MNKRDAIGFRGTLRGHGDWVTQIATTAQYPDILVSSSRDKSLIIWELTHRPEDYGVAKRSLHGHNHFISDVVLSSDGRFALSGSWDKSLRLWDLTTCQTSKRFVGHEGDVLSVAFSADSRQIVSGSRDRTAKLWNTIGMCKYSFEEEGHSDWVSCVRFSPSVGNHTMVSCGWDKIVKVWDVKESRLADNHVGHTGYLNTVTVSPDGTLCSSGGKDGQAMLWDLNAKKFLYMLQGGGVINALCFSPNRYWLCAAIGSTIKIWDLEEKSLYEELIPENVVSKNTICTCLAWSADGQTLFAGYSDNLIRVWEIMPSDDR